MENALELAGALIARFREMGLITGELDAECEGYRPSSNFDDFFDRVSGGNFSPLGHRTNGVEPTVTRYFNPYSIGPSFVHLTCPNCQTRFEDIDRAILDQIGHGFSSWMERGEVTDVVCPRCSKAAAINGWECRPPIGMGNLALIFWNWPRLDSPGWRIDLRKVVSEVTGHPTVYTWGKI